jgi:hypothetical protein
MSRVSEKLPKRIFTYGDLATCAERETNMRRQVYRNRILTRRMTQQQANREIDMMREIGEVLRSLAVSERLL